MGRQAILIPLKDGTSHKLDLQRKAPQMEIAGPQAISNHKQFPTRKRIEIN